MTKGLPAILLILSAARAAAALPAQVAHPNGIVDLEVEAVPNERKVNVRYTVPSDPYAAEGTITSILFVHSADPITSISFDALVQTSSVRAFLWPGYPGESLEFSWTMPFGWTASNYACKYNGRRGISQMSNVVHAAEIDTIRPGAIGNLRTSGARENSLSLEWEEPGDDDMAGIPARIEVRRSLLAPSSFPDLQHWWGSADPILAGLPSPVGRGFLNRMELDGLQPGTTYHVGLRAVDSTSNEGDPSVIAAATLPKDPDNHGGGDAPCSGGPVPAALPLAALAALLAFLRR